MTLSALLEVLANNTSLTITLRDSKNNTLIMFNAQGYATIDPTISARTVTSVTIVDAKNVVVVIADTEEPSEP